MRFSYVVFFSFVCNLFFLSFLFFSSWLTSISSLYHRCQVFYVLLPVKKIIRLSCLVLSMYSEKYLSFKYILLPFRLIFNSQKKKKSVLLDERDLFLSNHVSQGSPWNCYKLPALMVMNNKLLWWSSEKFSPLIYASKTFGSPFLYFTERCDKSAFKIHVRVRFSIQEHRQILKNW